MCSDDLTKKLKRFQIKQKKKQIKFKSKYQEVLIKFQRIDDVSLMGPGSLMFLKIHGSLDHKTTCCCIYVYIFLLLLF